jgi:ribose 5-phosphate isomerase A
VSDADLTGAGAGSGHPSVEVRAAWKLAAARAAVAAIPNGAVIGLGTGTTADLMLAELAERVRREGLRVTGIPTSERTREEAARLGISLADINDDLAITFSIDGADEVALPRLDLIKGRGGALLREKLIAASSRYRVIIADASKVVTTLASHSPVPVEVVAFGWRRTAERLAALGARPALRAAKDDPTRPFVSDEGHYILDCHLGPMPRPEALAVRIKEVVGVVEHGLFIGMTERVYIAGPQGVRAYDRPD